jgi:hypothetical protein
MSENSEAAASEDMDKLRLCNRRRRACISMSLTLSSVKCLSACSRWYLRSSSLWSGYFNSCVCAWGGGGGGVESQKYQLEITLHIQGAIIQLGDSFRKSYFTAWCFRCSTAKATILLQE